MSATGWEMGFFVVFPILCQITRVRGGGDFSIHGRPSAQWVGEEEVERKGERSSHLIDF